MSIVQNTKSRTTEYISKYEIEMKPKTIKDMISVANSIRRMSEINEHTKSINYGNVTRNKKKYTRKHKHKERYE